MKTYARVRTSRPTPCSTLNTGASTRTVTPTLATTSLVGLLLAAPGCDPDKEDGDAADDHATEGHHDTGHDTEHGSGESGHDTGHDSGESGDSDSGESGTGEGIVIAGMWIETYRGGMVTHTIDDATWTQDDAEFGPLSLTVVSFDNDTRTVIADDGTAFSKLQWAWTDDDTQLWYCTAAFGAASAEEAEAADDADASDPASGGCGPFAWSMLSSG